MNILHSTENKKMHWLDIECMGMHTRHKLRLESGDSYVLKKAGFDLWMISHRNDNGEQKDCSTFTDSRIAARYWNQRLKDCTSAMNRAE